MNNDDILRELEKIATALKWAEEHLTKDSESKAAVHLSDRVLYTPLCTSVIAAHASAQKIHAAIQDSMDSDTLHLFDEWEQKTVPTLKATLRHLDEIANGDEGDPKEIRTFAGELKKRMEKDLGLDKVGGEQ